MFFAAFILIPVDGEHDCLEKRVNLCHGDQPAEMSDVSRFGLEEEEEVAIFLGLVIIGEEAFLNVCSIIEMAGDLILLYVVSLGS